VGSNLLGLLGQARALRALGLDFTLGLLEFDAGVRVDDRGVLDVVVELAAGAHVRLHVHLDARPVGPAEVALGSGEFLLHVDFGLVRVRVDDELVVVRDVAVLRAALDADGFPGGELRVEHGSGDADTLLSAALLAGVEPRAVQQLPEDLRDLFFRDAGAVVLDDERVVVPGVLDLYQEVWQDAGFLGGVEGVVDGLLDGRDEPPGSAVEAEHVLVLLEELGDGDLPLARGSSSAMPSPSASVDWKDVIRCLCFPLPRLKPPWYLR